MALVDVAALADLAQGVPAVVSVGKREIALVRVDDRVFALRNICPHQSQSFAGGVVANRIEGAGTPGAFSVRTDSPLLMCPWHHWEFDLASGKCAFDKKLRVRTYATVIRDARVFIDVDDESARTSEA